MSKSVPRSSLTDKQRKKVGDQSGKIIFWILEGRSTDYMAKELKLEYPWMVDSNINAMLYELLKWVGVKRYLKIIFLDLIFWFRRKRKRKSKYQTVRKDD